MAVSVAIDARLPIGNRQIRLVRITFDNSYPTGGEAVTPANFALGVITNVIPFAAYATLAGLSPLVVPAFDKANSKVLVFEQGVRTGPTAAAALANGALLENVSGTEGAARLATSAADTTYNLGGLKEIGNTADLSALVVSAIVVGY